MAIGAGEESTGYDGESPPGAPLGKIPLVVSCCACPKDTDWPEVCIGMWEMSTVSSLEDAASSKAEVGATAIEGSTTNGFGDGEISPETLPPFGAVIVETFMDLDDPLVLRFAVHSGTSWPRSFISPRAKSRAVWGRFVFLIEALQMVQILSVVLESCTSSYLICISRTPRY